jgi:uncharacterized membrane protein (DUF485 family)
METFTRYTSFTRSFLVWIIFIGLALFNTFAREFIGSGNFIAAGLTYLIPVIVLQSLAAILWTRLYLNRKGKKLYNPSDLFSDPGKV